MGALGGRVTVVTGGGAGLASPRPKAFAREGAQVFVACRNEDHGTQAVQQIAGAHGHATFVKTDVTQDDQVRVLAERAAVEHGHVDIWFNNAGTEGHTGDFTEAGDETVQQVLDTNIKGVYSGMRHAARRMVEGGIIVNMASFVGTKMPVPVSVSYGGTKAAVVSMTQSAAAALQDRGIAVFTLCPYIVDTPMVDRLTGGQGPDARAAFAAPFAPSRRLTQPEEIAEVVLSLANGTSGYRSGEALVIDAGPTVTAFNE